MRIPALNWNDITVVLIELTVLYVLIDCRLCPCSIKIFNASEAQFAFMDDAVNMKLVFTGDNKIARIIFYHEGMVLC